MQLAPRPPREQRSWCSPTVAVVSTPHCNLALRYPTLTEAVYAQFRGPHYETPAEVRMAGIMGAGLVGMSTALDAIAAREAGMEVVGISLMTNHAAGIQKTPLSHEEVLQAGRDAEGRIGKLLAEIVAKF